MLNQKKAPISCFIFTGLLDKTFSIFRNHFGYLNFNPDFDILNQKAVKSQSTPPYICTFKKINEKIHIPFGRCVCSE